MTKSPMVKAPEATPLPAIRETAKKAWKLKVTISSSSRNGYGGRVGPGSMPQMTLANR